MMVPVSPEYAQQMPFIRDIVVHAIGMGEYDTSWIELTGEVLLSVPCVDGIVIVIREDWGLKQKGS